MIKGTKVVATEDIIKEIPKGSTGICTGIDQWGDWYFEFDSFPVETLGNLPKGVCIGKELNLVKEVEHQ